MNPGGTALTVIPAGPYSSARDFVRPLTRGLGRDVVRHARDAGVCARRADVHDAAPAGVDHVGQHRLTAVEDTVEVDVEHSLPNVEGDVGETREAVQPSGVHQNGHRAELSTNRVEGRVDLLAVGDVGGVGEIGVRRLKVDGGDVVAIGFEARRDGAADARRSAGDDGCLHE